MFPAFLKLFSITYPALLRVMPSVFAQEKALLKLVSEPSFMSAFVVWKLWTFKNDHTTRSNHFALILGDSFRLTPQNEVQSV